MLPNLLRNLFSGDSAKEDPARRAPEGIVVVKCPGCGQENRSTVGWLKYSQSLKCTGCGVVGPIEFKSRDCEIRPVE
jgi:predicted RNA-binding Zn-ribbon protein involved in translation (DUF1610 family)